MSFHRILPRIWIHFSTSQLLATGTHQRVVEDLDHLSRDVLRRGLDVRTAPLRAKDNGVREVGRVPPPLREDSDEPHVGPHFGLVDVDPMAKGEPRYTWIGGGTVRALKAIRSSQGVARGRSLNFRQIDLFVVPRSTSSLSARNFQ